MPLRKLSLFMSGLFCFGIGLAGPVMSAGGSANCYTGPGTQYPVAAKIASDHTLGAIETFNGWSKVNANGTRCWARPGKSAAHAQTKGDASGGTKAHHKVAKPAAVRTTRTVRYYNQSVKNPQYSTWQEPVYSAYDARVGYGYYYPPVSYYGPSKLW